MSRSSSRHSLRSHHLGAFLTAIFFVLALLATIPRELKATDQPIRPYSIRPVVDKLSNMTEGV
jgi:hypothetical protein